MVDIVKILLEEKEIRKKYFENYLEYAKKIKEIAKEYFNDNFEKLIIFGSVVKGEYHIMLSDIDIAIILKKEIPLKEKIKFRILINNLFPENPFELHIIDKERWENWYKMFVKEYKEIS